MFKKVLSSLVIKSRILVTEKRYRCNNRQYRYLLQKDDSSSTLIVIFSGFPGPGRKAGYNYIRTLRNIKCHKIFLLDNFGYQQRGAYYLAENGDFAIGQAVNSLICDVCRKLNIQKTIYLGSSKGGYAALFYGIQNGAAAVISGSPQYYLGKYLSPPAHQPILTAMIGDTSTAGVARLDRLLADVIAARARTDRSNKPEVYLHYSQNEPAYAEHIRDLVTALQEHGYKLSQNIGDYLNHGDLVHYFPAYLLDVLTNKLGVPLKKGKLRP